AATAVAGDAGRRAGPDAVAAVRALRQAGAGADVAEVGARAVLGAAAVRAAGVGVCAAVAIALDLRAEERAQAVVTTGALVRDDAVLAAVLDADGARL